MMSPSPATRTESDTFGPIEVPADRYWGAQTQRSLQNFRIGGERMPRPLVHALGLVKQAAALVNKDLGVLEPRARRCHRERRRRGGRGPARRRVSAGGLADRLRHPDQHERQRGDRQPRQPRCSAASAARSAGPPERPRQPRPVLERHLPDRHAHRGGARRSASALLPGAARTCTDALDDEGRRRSTTSSRSAAPTCRTRRRVTLGQEFSGYVAQLEHGIRRIEATLPDVLALALGGTAVGTGLNAHPEFAERFAAKVAELTGLPFTSAPNKFEALAAHDALVFAHGALEEPRRRR